MSLNIYEENCRALQTVNPRLAKRLGQLADEGLYMPIESAQKDQPNLLYKGLAPPILFYDRRIPSRMQSDTSAVCSAGMNRF